MKRMFWLWIATAAGSLFNLAAPRSASPKAYALEQRMSGIAARTPWPQPQPSGQTMTSSGVTDNSYGAGNGLTQDANSSQNDVQSADAWQPAGGFRGGIAYYNDLRNSYSNSVAVNKANINWLGGPFINAFNVLQSSHAALADDHNRLHQDHFNLEQAHNSLLTTLAKANILQ